MNRHYQPKHAVFHSPWIKAHPEFLQVKKDGAQWSNYRVEYFFDEARQERLDIFEEAAGYGPDGLVVGCCRQPPMAGYNPRMVEAYRRETGDDPRDLDITDGERFRKWLRWRAQWFTILMRELRRRIGVVEEHVGHSIPIAVRIPGGGLKWNLAEGMDVETWVRKGLIDELMLDPLEDSRDQGSHDVRPYVKLCRTHGIRVFGGVNPTACWPAWTIGDLHNPVVGLRRALGCLHAGVDGLEIYESECFAQCSHDRWLIPMWGNAELCEKFLSESNMEAVFPITASDALMGHDNHWLAILSLKGRHGDPLPRGIRDFL